MAPAKKSTNKTKLAKPKAGAAKARTAKASTTKAGAVVKTATQSQTTRRADIDDGDRKTDRETDIAEDNDIDDEGGDGDDVAELETRSKSGVAVSKGFQRPVTRPTNINQHPGEQQKALDKKRRTKEQMLEVRRQEAEQKRRKEEAERQKQAAQDKAVDRVAQFEMELIDDAFDDTPLPHKRKVLQFNRAVVDQRESDQDDDDVDDGADDGARGSDTIDVDEIEKVTPARASKRKGRAARADVEEEVIQETSASESEDRPKKKAKGKAVNTHVPSDSEVEIVDSEPKRHGKIPKKTIRDAITDKKNTDQNLGIDKADKARSFDAPGKLKPQRYIFLTIVTMLTLDETTVFYYTISANKDEKQSGLIKNWVDKVAKSKAASTAASNSRASSTLQASATSKPKSRPIKREGAVLDIHDIGGLSDHDKIQGTEREAAVKSPPKNGVRATSSVSNQYDIFSN